MVTSTPMGGRGGEPTEAKRFGRLSEGQSRHHIPAAQG